jgi:hypothetical protein
LSRVTADLKDIFRTVCSLSVEPDGLVFLVDTVKAEALREEAAYGGIRVSLEAHLDRSSRSKKLKGAE